MRVEGLKVDVSNVMSCSGGARELARCRLAVSVGEEIFE